MPIYETGHAVNIQNLGTMISRCTGYGLRYNPTSNRIKVASLTTLKSNADAAQTLISTTKPLYETTTNLRQQKFIDMEKLCTRVINAFDAIEDITDDDVADAKEILRKIRGERKSKVILNPGPDDAQQISASQLSYAQQLNHFEQFKNYITSFAIYVPNEVELKTPALNTFFTDLKAAFDDCVAATTPYLNAIIARNELLYAKTTGLVDVALEAKKYTKSVQAITLPEFRLISGLKFTRPKKKA
jgi:hypothetical protein